MLDLLKSIIGTRDKTVGLVTSSNLLFSLANLLSGFLVAKWLLPEELGQFNVLSIFTSYIILVQIGIPSGLSREFPFFWGKREREKAVEVAETAKFYMLYLSLLILLVTFIVGIYYYAIEELNKYAIGSIVVGITCFQSLYVNKYLKILYKSENEFIKLSHIKFISVIINLSSLILVYKFQFYGLCLRAILVTIFDFYFTNKWKPIAVSVKFRFKTIKELIVTGMPIYSVASIIGLWPTVQRTLIVSYLGTKGLGLYTLSIVLQNLLNTFNSSISNVSFPLMSKAYGKGASLLDLLKIPGRYFIISVIVYSIGATVGWYLIPIIVANYLPEYAEGIEAAQWMLLVSVVSSFSIFSNIYMVI